VRAIHGREAVESVELTDGGRRCDLVVIAAGERPADEVACQADIREEPRPAPARLGAATDR
jgi:NAD(P)H-nitrite reductase large subunit